MVRFCVKNIRIDGFANRQGSGSLSVPHNSIADSRILAASLVLLFKIRRACTKLALIWHGSTAKIEVIEKK